MSEYIYIISEYNPPHTGHEHMISELRNRYADATVVAIMSGNIVERGSPAIVNKYARAKAALSIGADLVLSLPFPWCAASAEFFARAGVCIASSLASALPCDMHLLAFGSESGDIDRITLTGSRLASRELRDRLASLPAYERTARSLSSVYASLYPDGTSELLSSPNDTLAVEYVRAICELSSSLIPVTVKRLGAEHDAHGTDVHPSASFVRECIRTGGDIRGLVPDAVRDIILSELSAYGAADESHYGEALLGFLRVLAPETADSFAECGGGVGRRLISSASSSASMSDALAAAATKQYTNARLRRAAIYAYLGITPEKLRALPEYTSVLAANEKGTLALREYARRADIAILTKAADAPVKLSPSAKRQFDTDSRADALYTLAFGPHLPRDAFSRLSPTVSKARGTEKA